ncbi:MAG TPA: hypothetical protein VJ874_00050 [Candidatus Thermoplasmatota archaeon]|nr:hypothetical protein [Candidatus Thermoplasmatota archaeon]
MRTLIPLAIAALLTLAPAAAQDDATPACPDGQVESPEGCSDQAWVDPEDCPPEHLCAAGEPQQYGDEDCIDCISAPSQDPQTCMDGAQEGETCQDDVQYIGGPGQAPPADGEADDTDADAESRAGDKDTPALAAVLLMAVLGAVVLVLRRT